MRVRTRLALALVVAALLPVAGAGVLVGRALGGASAEAQSHEREAAIARGRRALADALEAHVATARRTCMSDEGLLRLAAGSLLPREETRTIAEGVRAALDAHGVIVARNGLVLASVGFATGEDRSPHDAAAPMPTEVLRRARVDDANVTFELTCAAHGANGVAVVTAVYRADDLLGVAALGGPMLHVARADRVDNPPASSHAPLALSGLDADPPLALVATSSGPLERAHGDLDRIFLFAALFAVSIAVLVAMILTPPLARPLREVADAAERIARGTRSVRVGETAAGEAGKLIFAFNRMARELDAAESRLRRVERIAAWRDIARQMAHEIKNPLTPIQIAVESLRKARERQLPDFDALFDEETRIVLEEVARLKRLVENFSRFARAPKPRLESVSVTDIVSHVVGLQAAAGGAEITGEAEPELPSIRADREQLTQVLMNLVQNAALAAEERARAAPEKGPAAVHVSANNLRDGRVRIAIEDNGAGIDPTVQARLFEPYVTTRQGKGGTGLGLAIAFRIVTDHGGTIAAETSPEGTRFDVVLPIAGPSAQDVTLDSDDTKLPT